MDTDFRPYAATANVLAMIDRSRTRNLPETITNDFLALTGIPEVVYGRVRQALEFLDLIHEDNRPTEKLQSLAKVQASEFPELFADCIREAYREDFQRIDPGQDNQAVIIEAFRRYQPRSQTSRMVMLFLGLCRAAGMAVLDAPRERKMQGFDGERKPRTLRLPKGTKFPNLDNRRESPGLDFLRSKPPISLFAVSEDDIAALDEVEFDEVWAALGKVARARARARKTPASQSEPPSDGQAGDA